MEIADADPMRRDRSNRLLMELASGGCCGGTVALLTRAMQMQQGKLERSNSGVAFAGPPALRVDIQQRGPVSEVVLTQSPTPLQRMRPWRPPRRRRRPCTLTCG